MEPTEDSAHDLAIASAQEPPVHVLPAESRSFVHGIAVGFACALVLIHVWLATELGQLPEMYRDFGGPLPAVTRITISAA